MILEVDVFQVRIDQLVFTLNSLAVGKHRFEIARERVYGRSLIDPDRPLFSLDTIVDVIRFAQGRRTLLHLRFGCCRKLTEGGERFFRTLAGLLRSRGIARRREIPKIL